MRISWRAALVAVVAVVLSSGLTAHAADPTPDVAYPDDPALQQAYETGFYRGSEAGRVQGRDDGYDDGYRAGIAEGAAQARAEDDQDDLRDDVENQVEEGGADLGEQLLSPTPTPPPSTTTASSVSPPDHQSSGPGFPWWPVSFAVVATVWFVTRRRRFDTEESTRS